jgi:hypothetical protein
MGLRQEAERVVKMIEDVTDVLHCYLRWKPERDEELLFKYAGPSSLDFIPAAPEIRMFNAKGMKDWKEGTLLEPALRDRADYGAIVKFRWPGYMSNQQDEMLSSFSLREDSVELWREYADNGEGLCFGITTADLPPSVKKMLFQVSYSKDMEDEVANAFRQPFAHAVHLLEELQAYANMYHAGASEITTKILDAVETSFDSLNFLFKSPGHAHESEVRLRSRESVAKLEPTKVKDQDRFFYRLPGFYTGSIRRVWIGPRSGLTETAVRICLRNKGLSDVGVMKTKTTL